MISRMTAMPATSRPETAAKRLTSKYLTITYPAAARRPNCSMKRSTGRRLREFEGPRDSTMRCCRQTVKKDAAAQTRKPAPVRSPNTMDTTMVPAVPRIMTVRRMRRTGPSYWASSLAVIGFVQLTDELDHARCDAEQEEDDLEESGPKGLVEEVADGVTDEDAGGKQAREAVILTEAAPEVVLGHLRALFSPQGASFSRQDGGGLLGGFFHEEPHLGMRRRDVRLDAIFLERLGCRGPDRRDHGVAETGPHGVGHALLGRHLHEVRDLNGCGEQDHVDIRAGDAVGGLSQRSRVLRQFPLVDANVRH